MPVSHIDFANLDLGDALDLAILIEQEAEERYKDFCASMQLHHNTTVASFFCTMAGYEAAHGTELSRLRASLVGDRPRHIGAEQIFDVEAPGFETITTFMELREALQIAREAEEKALAFYVKALERVTHDDVRDLFEKLRQEECEHIALVQRELDQLGPEEGHVPEDAFSDPPVAQ